MGSAGRIFDNFQYRSPPIGNHRIAFARDYAFQRNATMFHGHKLRHVIGIQCPAIDYLRAMGIDDFNVLALCYECRFGMPRGYGYFTDVVFGFYLGHFSIRRYLLLIFEFPS